MPFFNWLAVNKNGAMSSGKIFSNSLGTAKKDISVQGLSLISIAEQAQSVKLFKRQVSLEDKVNFFAQLHQLLDSGIMLPKALFVLSNSSARTEEVVSALYLLVEKGSSFSSALKEFPKVFSTYEVQMALAGEEAGDLQRAVKSIAEALSFKFEFNSRLRALLFLPVITLAFFVLISTIIFFYIIPSFSSILTDNGVQEVGFVFKVSLWLVAFGAKKIFLIAAAFALSLFLFFKTGSGKRVRDFVAIKLPFFKQVTFYINLTYFLDSLAFMLLAGVKLDGALDVCQNSVGNIYLRKIFSRLSSLVQEGFSLEQAMVALKIFPIELLAMVGVGQESGNLALMMQRAANIYQQKSSKIISSFLNLFQPILMLLLGILVTALLFSVYMPIFDLASNIQA
jgi:type II secretory pathway component PulF